MLQQILFLLVMGLMAFFSFGRYRDIFRNIRLGKPMTLEGSKRQRWKNVLYVAFGQRKMFKHPLPAILHLFIYVAFLFTQVELFEIVVDGLTGMHRALAPALGLFYSFIINFIEVLSLLALAATVVFLWRRNVKKVARLTSPEMKGWPGLDGNLILVGELLLITGIFSMNGADGVLQSIDPEHYPNTGKLVISSLLSANLFADMSHQSLIIIERVGWWLHFIVVMGFIAYLPFSKHLHIFLAFFNTYFSSLGSRGKMENMPEIAKEVRVMMGLEEETNSPADDLPEFGAKDIFGLSQRTLLGAYSCTECGRCTSQCPAHITGKKLSPRKIMMDIRDRMEEVRAKIKTGDTSYFNTADDTDENAVFNDGKSLFDLIDRQELHACTTCNACVEACPILINPLEPILALRRYEILTESAGPPDWLPMFNSLESSQSPWQIPDPRDTWASEARSKNE